VQSATLNGSRFNNTWLDYSQIISGGTLDFTMGSKPSQWGARTAPAYSLDNDSGDTGGSGADQGDTVVSARPGTVATAADGTLDGSVKLTLSGPASFAARRGTSLTRTGAASVTGLPSGVTADLQVTDARTATLSLTGTATVDAHVGITFQDAAFAHGVRAATVTGTGVSPTDPLVVSAAAVQRKALAGLVDQASLVRSGNYSDGSWTLFRSALERARTVLADPAAATGTIMAADDALHSAVAALVIDEGGYAVLQAESSDEKEGPSLSSEAYYSDGDLGGVTEGAWERFNKLDFGGVAPRSIAVRYANSQAASAKPSSVDIHAGGADGPVVATVSLPGTGGWQYYSTVQAAVTDPNALLGASGATFVFHAPAGQSWVSNFDWYQFSPNGVSSSPTTTLATLNAANSTATGGGSSPLNTANGIFENVTDGAWAQWHGIDLGDGADTVTVSYDKPQSRAASDSHIELHLAAKDGPKAVAVPLDYTGSGWGTVATTSVHLDPSVFAGVQDVYADFVSSTQTAAQPYVGNVYSLTLTRTAHAPVAFDATAFDSNSGGGLKSEPVGWTGAGSTTDLGGTYNGAWAGYGTIDFGSSPKNTVTITYVNNSARCGSGSAVQLYLDSFDPAGPGAPYATVTLPVTGAAWSSGGTTSLTLPKGITGTHTVHLRLVTTPDSSHPYVANLGRITFGHADTLVTTDKTALSKAIDAYAGLSGDAARYDTIDFGVYQRELAAARALVDADDATQPEVDTQTRSLTLAADQLVPLPRLRLEDLVTTASALDDARYTDASWQAFTAALTAAKSAVADTTTADEALTARYAALDHAQSALTTKPRTVPAAPGTVSATASGTSVTVAWSAPADTGGSPLTGFRIALDDGHQVEVHDPASRSTTFSWLRAGRSYTARVQAVNAVGASHPSPATAPVLTGGAKPHTPDLTGVTTDGRQVRVTWQPAGDGGSPVIGWTVTLDDGTTAHLPATADTALLTTTSRAKAHTATVTALTLAGTSDGPATAAPVSATTDASDPAYVSSPFPDGTMNAAYGSDSWPATGDGRFYFEDLLDGINDLHADILAPNTKVPAGTPPTAQNDKIAMGINNTAPQAQVDRAEIDATNSSTVTMADGLGSRLGRIYSDALSSGALPKTNQLFGRVTQGLDQGGTAKDHYAYPRPYVRLGFVGDGGDVYESQDGSYGSLTTSGSYPSGHTYGGYEAGTILATLLPELAPSILARTSEYGNNRIVLGFHYPLDVMGGRIAGQATVAHRWADPQFADLLMQAHTEIENVLLDTCEKEGYGTTLAACEGDTYDGLSTSQDVDLYTQRLSYGFSQDGPSGQTLKTPSDAAALLITAFPDLTTEQRVQVLQQTATDSGYPLDLTGDGGASWERINLAAAMAAHVVVNADGSVTVTNFADATKASVADADAITVGGARIDGFDPKVSTYVVDWPKNARIPAVSAVPAQSGARVKTVDGGQVLTSAGSRFTTRTITVTSANGAVTRTYTVGFQLTDRDNRPVSAGGHGGEPWGPGGPWGAGGSWGPGGDGPHSAGVAGILTPATEGPQPFRTLRALS
jgi:hypothetical protein